MTEAPATTQTAATTDSETYTVTVPGMGVINWKPDPAVALLTRDITSIMGDHEVPALLEKMLTDITSVVAVAHMTVSSVIANLQSGNITPEERLEALLDILGDDAGPTLSAGVDMILLGETPDGPDIVEAERMIAEADLR